MIQFMLNVQNWVRKYTSGCQGQGVRQMGETANGDGISLADDESILELDSGDDCTILWID